MLLQLVHYNKVTCKKIINLQNNADKNQEL